MPRSAGGRPDAAGPGRASRSLTKGGLDPDNTSVTRYEILPHTADGKFRAYGGTLEEAFANAALATASLMWDWERIEPRLEVLVDIGARDRERLLVGFLSEVVFLFDARRFMLARVDRLRIEEAAPFRDPQGSTDTPGSLLVSPDSRFRLAARLLGDAFNDRSELHGAVKAVTYSEMKIERCGCGVDLGGGPDGAPGGGYVVQVVVDM